MFTYFQLHTPFPPVSLYLISLMVSVDVKHDVYLLAPPYPLSLISLMISVDTKHHLYLLTY